MRTCHPPPFLHEKQKFRHDLFAWRYSRTRPNPAVSFAARAFTFAFLFNFPPAPPRIKNYVKPGGPVGWRCRMKSGVLEAMCGQFFFPCFVFLLLILGRFSCGAKPFGNTKTTNDHPVGCGCGGQGGKRETAP